MLKSFQVLNPFPFPNHLRNVLHVVRSERFGVIAFLKYLTPHSGLEVLIRKKVLGQSGLDLNRCGECQDNGRDSAGERVIQTKHPIRLPKVVLGGFFP